MYPHVRQLTARWPEHEREPRSRAEIPADPKPAERKRARRSSGRSRYKVALLTWAGAYAVITAILAMLGPTLASWPLVLRTLALSVLMVIALTWLVMPALTRLFRAWLTPPG
jgi:antibiotic biosynthesis monooxygenase (ABM) superfamily enzyme